MLLVFLFKISVDHWSHLRWNHWLLLWTRIFLWACWFVLPINGNNIFDRNVLPVNIMPLLIEYGRHHLENNLRKFNHNFHEILFIQEKLDLGANGIDQFLFNLQELIYHSIAAILLLAASIWLFVRVEDYKRHSLYNQYLAVAVLGLINTILYLCSAVLARRTYRGI